MKLKGTRYHLRMFSFALSIVNTLFIVLPARSADLIASYHALPFLYCTSRFSSSIGAAADLSVLGGASHLLDVPSEGEPTAGPVVPRGIRLRLPAVSHLSAAHLFLRFGHHLHVVSLDQSVLVRQS